MTLDANEVEIAVLRHQLAVLRRQVPGSPNSARSKDSPPPCSLSSHYPVGGFTAIRTAAFIAAESDRRLTLLYAQPVSPFPAGTTDRSDA